MLIPGFRRLESGRGDYLLSLSDEIILLPRSLEFSHEYLSESEKNKKRLMIFVLNRITRMHIEEPLQFLSERI